MSLHNGFFNTFLKLRPKIKKTKENCMKNFSGNWVWFCDIENMYNHIYSVWTWISHHVPQVVHAQLVRVDPQLILLVVGLNQLHVLLPDGPADGLLTLQQTRDRETVWQQWQWRLLVSVTIWIGKLVSSGHIILGWWDPGKGFQISV